MSSSAPTLPIELYRQIVLDPVLNLRDLLSLSLTSRAFCSEAYSALHSRVELRTSQETKLALRMFIESDRVVKVVRELVLRPDEAFRVEFGKETPFMIRAIHRMINLKALTLGYLWTADPFGEAHNMLGAAASPGTHDRDMPQPQLGPPGPGRTAWTRGLQIPHIERLTIEANTYRPIRDLFGALPDPLPHLVCIRPLHIRDIKGIRKVTCERLYGQIPIGEGKNSDEGLLSALEYLEVANLDSYPTQPTWAPRLTTISMIVSGGRGRYFIPIQSFGYMKSIKKIGPVDCHEKEVFEDFLNEVPKLSQLEGIVLVLRRIDYRDFGSREIERMERAAPRLQWIALVPKNPKRSGEYLEYKKWSMEVKDNSATGELVRWYMEKGSIDDWGHTLSVLLDTP